MVSQHPIEVHAPTAHFGTLNVKWGHLCLTHVLAQKQAPGLFPGSPRVWLQADTAPAISYETEGCELPSPHVFWLARACPRCMDPMPTECPARAAFPMLSFLVSFTKPSWYGEDAACSSWEGRRNLGSKRVFFEVQPCSDTASCVQRG